jgi:hypothetical protein
MIYYAIVLIFSLCMFEANSAESTKGPPKLEPLEKIPSFKPLKTSDSFPSPKRSAKLESLEKIPDFKPLKVSDTLPSPKKPMQLDPIITPSKAEPITRSVDGFGSASSVESFTSVESFPSVTESMTSEGSSTGFPVKEAHEAAHEKTDESLMPVQFPLTDRIQGLMLSLIHI